MRVKVMAAGLLVGQASMRPVGLGSGWPASGVSRVELCSPGLFGLLGLLGFEPLRMASGMVKVTKVGRVVGMILLPYCFATRSP